MYKLITSYASDYGKESVIIKHFADTESYVQIPQIDSLKGKGITIYHRLYPEPDKRIFELLLMLSKLKGVAKSIALFTPYLPYARQDRENKQGEAVSADVLCKLLKSSGVKKLITYDCHFLPRPGRFSRAGLVIENRSAGPELMKYAKKYFKSEKFVVIAPDEGSSYFIENAKGHVSHRLEKTRHESKSNGVNTSIHAEINKIEGHADVHGKNVCILDDIIATGGTIMHACKHLRSLGAKKIIVGATHGVFAGVDIAEKILKSSCGHVFTTNSIMQENPKITVVPLK